MFSGSAAPVLGITQVPQFCGPAVLDESLHRDYGIKESKEETMAILGALIGVGAAVVFLLVGALALFGGTDATRKQLLPGFAPDRPAFIERALSFLSLWGPVALVALLCLLAGIQIVRIALAAFV
jgi:hypothetical protein